MRCTRKRGIRYQEIPRLARVPPNHLAVGRSCESQEPSSSPCASSVRMLSAACGMNRTPIWASGRLSRIWRALEDSELIGVPYVTDFRTVAMHFKGWKKTDPSGSIWRARYFLRANSSIAFLFARNTCTLSLPSPLKLSSSACWLISHLTRVSRSCPKKPRLPGRRYAPEAPAVEFREYVRRNSYSSEKAA
jgi:hypothetical protein